ncbi:MAG: lamin tail domain-containing protein [Chloroflexi bacterium]|nr:lamin tail domain-containing protein [Chloroflexota bacterium]
MLSRITTFVTILLWASCLWALSTAMNEFRVHASSALQSATPAGQADLRINEFMADNVTVLQDPDEPGEFPDWIELYNGGSDPVSLDGLFLSDDPALPRKYAIPAGLSIASHGFMLFYADDDGKQGPQHLSFKLSATGEFIGLYGAKGATILDSYTFGAQTPDVASGRQPDGTGPWRFIAKPTPGKSNAIPAPAILSVQRNPVQPEATTSVTVTAVITNDGLGITRPRWSSMKSWPITKAFWKIPPAPANSPIGLSCIILGQLPLASILSI